VEQRMKRGLALPAEKIDMGSNNMWPRTGAQSTCGREQVLNQLVAANRCSINLWPQITETKIIDYFV